jgi:hypothetical protein
MFAVWPRRRWDNATDHEKNGSEGRSCRWANDVMRVLAKGAICVSRSVCMKVRKLGGGSENEQEPEKGHKQNTSHRTGGSYSVTEHHN